MTQYNSFFIPNFLVSNIINPGMDDWINDPNHIRHKYGFIDVILEHIENTKYFEPIMIMYHHDKDVSAGPSGVARLYGATHRWDWNYVPAIVVTPIPICDTITNIFNKTLITTREQLRSYFILEPANYGIEEDGRVYWHNQNPNPKQAIETLNVSPKSLANFLKCIEA